MDSQKIWETIKAFRVSWLLMPKLLLRRKKKFLAYASESGRERAEANRRLAVVAHVYYPEFIDVLVSNLELFPNPCVFFFSTSSLEIRNRLIARTAGSGREVHIQLTPNVGRNFAPLFVEFSNSLMAFEEFIHLHSKRSIHSKEGLGKIWAKRHTELLMTPAGLSRTLGVADSEPSVGLIYPDNSDLFRALNFTWGRNFKYAASLADRIEELPKPRVFEVLNFPAGGMFWARVDALLPLLQHDWKYEDFPMERGQLDGTLHHAIERMIGSTATAMNYKHAHYVLSEDRFGLT